MKLKRDAYRLFLNTKGKESPNWNWLGDDMDEMNVDMNGTFETTKNIKGQNSVSDEGYTPSVSATPYYADPEDGIYDFLEDLALGRKSGDDCLAEYMEVVIKNTEDSKHLAYKEDCKIEINSYGGPTTGFRIEFTVHPAGNRKKGYVTINEEKPAFTEGEISSVQVTEG